MAGYKLGSRVGYLDKAASELLGLVENGTTWGQVWRAGEKWRMLSLIVSTQNSNSSTWLTFQHTTKLRILQEIISSCDYDVMKGHYLRKLVPMWS